ADVETRVMISNDKRRKEIVFAIKEGRGSYVASIKFPGATVFGEKLLRDQIYDTIESTLSEEVGRPGADSDTVDAILRGSSVGRLGPPPPDTSAPDLPTLYVPRAYKAAKDSIADLYKAAGYQSVKIEDPVPRTRENSELLDISIGVREGVRWVVGAISFT